MILEEYRKKRDFGMTKEPIPGTWVIQLHHARALHYDFRIEHQGVLKSWAVPKGLPTGKEKRLAVETEDHPIGYASFEGTIPKGQYGGGRVTIWDKGTYCNKSSVSMEESIKKGHIRIEIRGEKQTGEFSIIKTKKTKQWLIIKHEQTGEISNPEKIIYPQKGYSKLNLVQYYKAVSEYMLPHLKDRPISMLRFPNGAPGKKFFQKNVPEYFLKWMKTAEIDGTRYAICNDEKTLLYLANQVMVPHTWLSRVDKPGLPDRMIFDIDPQNGNYKDAVECANAIKVSLNEIRMRSYLMTTGSKGLHVVVAIKRELEFKKVQSFAGVIARHVEKTDPEKYTTEFTKEKRQAKVYIDIFRNSYSQTSVAPYAARANEGGYVAAPINWEEAPNARYDIFTIKERLEKKGDPWGKLEPQSIKKIIMRG
ncbi:hypothetical protein HYU11_02920 [Candidatus Woesearchaeota archaeon]|nr:hypothetical protein [Candidatus Woesearchaeota archaeon]